MSPWERRGLLGVGKMPESEVGGCIRVDRDRTRREISHSSGRRGNGRHGCNTLRLPYPFEVGEEESVILHNRPANSSTELVALGWWNTADIEVILGVQPAIA